MTPLIPWGVVCHDLVHVADVHHILGLALVVGDAGVLEPVAPQDLIGKVARPDLEKENIEMENIFPVIPCLYGVPSLRCYSL